MQISYKVVASVFIIPNWMLRDQIGDSFPHIYLDLNMVQPILFCHRQTFAVIKAYLTLFSLINVPNLYIHY